MYLIGATKDDRERAVEAAEKERHRLEVAEAMAAVSSAANAVEARRIGMM
jgi:hypothetical protein